MTAAATFEHNALSGVAAAAATASPGDYLTFVLGAERYAISILDVQEIRSYETPTRLVGSLAHVKGIIKLRETIVPIVDMRELFDCAAAGITDTTIFVVVNVGGRVVGAIVDAVNDVVELSADDIKPVPSVGASQASRHISALASKDDQMLILVDMRSLLSSASADYQA